MIYEEKPREITAVQFKLDIQQIIEIRKLTGLDMELNMPKYGPPELILKKAGETKDGEKQDLILYPQDYIIKTGFGDFRKEGAPKFESKWAPKERIDTDDQRDSSAQR